MINRLILSIRQIFYWKHNSGQIFYDKQFSVHPSRPSDILVCKPMLMLKLIN